MKAAKNKVASACFNLIIDIPVMDNPSWVFLLFDIPVSGSSRHQVDPGFWILQFLINI